MLASENGTISSVDFMSRFMQRPWDRTAMVSICVYVCVCKCVCVYLYKWDTCVNVCMCICVYVFCHDSCSCLRIILLWYVRPKQYDPIHTYIHTYIHNTAMCPSIHTYIHTYIHTHRNPPLSFGSIHTCTHTHIHTHTHTHTHTQQILPRREGDLEMQEGGVFKSWNRYKFVLKDHCLEFHRYLPTGLHDPKVCVYVCVYVDICTYVCVYV